MERHSVQPVLMSVSSHLVHREGVGELAVQRRPALRGGVALQHPRGILEFVAGYVFSDLHVTEMAIACYPYAADRSRMPNGAVRQRYQGRLRGSSYEAEPLTA
jgi:hypothetical protein